MRNRFLLLFLAVAATIPSAQGLADEMPPYNLERFCSIGRAMNRRDAISFWDQKVWKSLKKRYNDAGYSTLAVMEHHARTIVEMNSMCPDVW